jgi:hypothetical protein
MSLTPPLSSPAGENIEAWSQLPRVLVITQEGAGAIVTSEVNGELRASQPGAFGNQRQAHLTQWRAADSEIVSLWGPPSTFSTPTGKPQIGHIHRCNLMADGRSHQAIAVFHDAFLGQPHQLHCEVINFDGATLTQIQDSPLTKSTLVKALKVWWGRRFSFGLQFAEYNSEPRDLRLVEDGDIVRVANMAATGLNTPVTGLPVTNSVPEQGFFRLTFSGTDLVDGLAGGDVTWTDTTNTAKDKMPFWVRSRVDGSRLRVRQWVHGEPEPRTWDKDVTFTDDRMPKADGWNGVWVGHVYSGSYHKFRYLSIQRLR